MGATDSVLSSPCLFAISIADDFTESNYKAQLQSGV